MMGCRVWLKSKKDRKGLVQMANLSVFDHSRPFWAHLDPFGPFQTRIDILLQSTSAKPYFVHLGQKIMSEMVQKGPDGPKRGPK